MLLCPSRTYSNEGLIRPIDVRSVVSRLSPDELPAFPAHTRMSVGYFAGALCRRIDRFFLVTNDVQTGPTSLRAHRDTSPPPKQLRLFRGVAHLRDRTGRAMLVVPRERRLRSAGAMSAAATHRPASSCHDTSGHAGPQAISEAQPSGASSQHSPKSPPPRSRPPQE